MQKALFALKDIRYNRILIESTNLPLDEISIEFNPSGIIDISNNTYEMTLRFKAFDQELQSNNDFINIELVALFEFDDIQKEEDIPEHFYVNSIAIVYPYIRAFVTSIVFQANLERKVILPTMNLSSLGKVLKDKTLLK